ncbi:agroclavine dehydrogenase [Mycena capillaripes]|nr:agroclavine dehydrogenase [Mycena capillaripes]
MTILLTGGTGKSARPLATLLLKAKIPVLLANRSGKVPAPFQGVRFDWFDASTYQLPFEVDNNIDRIYLITPLVADPFPPMKAFIDLAIQKGVKRFVLMSAAVMEVGGPLMGKVHEYLSTLNVEYCALRPSWFFDNLLLYYGDHIREHNEIANGAGSGLIGWISIDDIADVAFKALTDPVIEHTNPVMVGPELFSYAQITQMLTEVLGRKISHKQLSQEEYSNVMVQRGMPEDYVAFMSLADVYISQGVEERAKTRMQRYGGAFN